MLAQAQVECKIRRRRVLSKVQDPLYGRQHCHTPSQPQIVLQHADARACPRRYQTAYSACRRG